MIEGESMSAHNKARLMAPPWRDRNPDGTLGVEYGPRTMTTFAKHVAAHRDWSYRVVTVSKAARSADAGELRAWMRLDDGTLRADVPKAELDAYLLVVEQGHSERWAAAKLGVSRRTVRVRLQRLAEKAGQG